MRSVQNTEKHLNKTCTYCGSKLLTMQSDSQERFDPDVTIGNDDLINIEMISDIEKELKESPYDMISLVFLLYNIPDTALQHLYVFQQISKDVDGYSNLNMLRDWYQSAKSTKTWKHEFVEALVICQLNSIVRKLGFNVSSAQKYYCSDNIAAKMYINPMKKALYKLCENMNSDNLLKLRKKLIIQEIDTTEYESCELILLKLMCEKFIVINQFQYNHKVLGFKVEMDKLVRIVKSLPGACMEKIAVDISLLQQSLNGEINQRPSVSTSTPAPLKVDETNPNSKEKKCYNNYDFIDIYEMMDDMKIDDNINDILKSDSKQLSPDSYEIRNHKRNGICAIINQENFFRADTYKSNDRVHHNILENRVGSHKDQIKLEETMSELNFDVKSEKDLDHIEMFEFIRGILKNDVRPDDSMFMLCILSHGVRGHVFAADSVKVNMDEIQRLLDSDEAFNLHNKPKIIIVQACQIEDRPSTLVPDGPKTRVADSYKIKKSDFFVCWATAPELEAYRDTRIGSIFIQILCRTLCEHAKKEHVVDLFTKVNYNVKTICTDLKCDQVPQFHSTLIKKLYLQIPQ